MKRPLLLEASKAINQVNLTKLREHSQKVGLPKRDRAFAQMLVTVTACPCGCSRIGEHIATGGVRLLYLL